MHPLQLIQKSRLVGKEGVEPSRPKTPGFESGAATNYATSPLTWWERRDSNPHARKHRVLNPTRLPITPLSQEFALYNHSAIAA